METRTRTVPSGRTVVTGSSDGSARLWNALPQGALTTIDRQDSVVRSFWAGRRVVSVAGSEARVLTPAGHVVQRLRMPEPIGPFAADGSTIALADRAGNLLLDRGGAVSLKRGAGATAVAVEPNGRVLVGRDGTVGYAGASPVLMRVGGRVLGLSTGGDRILVRLLDAIRVYTDSGRLVSTIHTSALHAVLSPGGRAVATTRATIAQVWDAATGRPRHTLTGHRSLVTDAEFSPNGLEIVTVSDDHTGLLWSARSGRLLHDLRGHILPIQTGRFSPDGQWIVTASQFTAGLFNARSGQLLFNLGRHTAQLTGASFSPDGKWILTGSKDGTARVYRCVICEPLPGLEAAAEARLQALR